MAGYVYLIGNPIFHWYKIGKSKAPEVRVTNLGILLPFKIRVFNVWRAENHHLMETTLHEIYAKHRINGEWFEFDRHVVAKLIASIPSESSIMSESLDSFSNIIVDEHESRRVIGVRRQKLRGDFTPEEREARKQASILEQKLKKAAKAVNRNVE